MTQSASDLVRPPPPSLCTQRTESSLNFKDYRRGGGGEISPMPPPLSPVVYLALREKKVLVAQQELESFRFFNSTLCFAFDKDLSQSPSSKKFSNPAKAE